jgi:hypothetical protein
MTAKYLIVVLNGPSHVGKTSIADKLCGTMSHPYGILNGRHFVCWHMKMIDPVRDAVMAMFTLDPYTFEDKKDVPILINDMTPRHAVIAADICIRRALGPGYLGEILSLDIRAAIHKGASFLHDKPWNIFIVDAGVKAEVDVLKKNFDKHVKVLHVYRNGLDFDDGRHYIEPCDAVVTNVDGQLNKAVDQTLLFINAWLEVLDDKGDAGTTAGVPEASTEHQPQS